MARPCGRSRFDGAALDGARAAWSVRHEPPPLLDGPLPARAPEDVSLADLKDFLVRPARAFLRGRLDVSAPFEPDELADAIPVDLNSLELWQVGDRLLRELLNGQDPVRVMTAEQLAERLPLASSAHKSLHDVAKECQQLWTRTAELREGTASSVDVDVDLGGGRRLTGTVTGVYATRVVSLGYSRLKPRQRLQTWVDVLALAATHDDTNWTGHAVGRERAGPKRALTGPVDDRATGWLRSLVELRDLGLTRPLPMPVATAAAWAEAHTRELHGQDVDPVEARTTRVGDRPAQQLRHRGRGRRPVPPPGLRRRRATREAGRRRASGLRLAGLGAAPHRSRTAGPAMTEDLEPFDITGDLPTGTVLLEASAGTGKTWTIGALVTRYVAEGHARLEEMLVVTFGRAASQELRERVRAQLVEAERVLSEDPAAALPDDVPPSDLVTFLRGWGDTDRRLGHRRVTQALAEFDAATIATTHQFCSMVLDSLGVAGDTDSRARLVEDLDDLVKETVDDLYLRAFAFDESGPAFTYAEAMAIARAAVNDPQSHLEPDAEDRTTPVGRRVGFATRRPHRARQAQAAARDPVLRRPAQPAP